MATANQIKVLNFINDEISANGICPTLREIGGAVNISHEWARKIILKLESQGFVQRKSDKIRAIKILKLPAEAKRAA
jgi:SOS-response transcriptional repressor LexA